MSHVASIQLLPCRAMSVEKRALAQLQRAPGGTFSRGMLHHAKALGFGANVTSLKALLLASMIRNAKQSLQHFQTAVDLLEYHVGIDCFSLTRTCVTTDVVLGRFDTVPFAYQLKRACDLHPLPPSVGSVHAFGKLPT